MLNKVKMNLSDEELLLIESLKETFKLSTNTGTISLALHLSKLIVDGIENGKQVVMVNQNNKPISQIIIPGVNNR